MAAKSKRSKGTKNRFSEADRRKAFAVAIINKDNFGYSWTKGAGAVGTHKSVVKHWSERYPEIFEDVKRQCQAELERVAPELADILLDVARRAAEEWLHRLKTKPSEIKEFALTGILDYAIKNANLLTDKPTGIEKHEHKHSLVEQMIMIIADERSKVVPNPRFNIQN
jgi:hypothetical protein